MNIQIWMEGYIATGEHGTAHKIWEGEAENFDDAVRQYTETQDPEDVKRYGPIPYTRASFTDEEAYQKRRSNWKIWGCALFDNETDARKAFG